MDEIHTRIAPTPSGFLHLGNAFSFLYTYLIHLTSPNSSLLLRIDDADAARCRDEYLEDIFHSLEWLGIAYTRGPSGVEDFKKNYSQQLRYDWYETDLLKLSTESKFVYACECSRKQIRSLSSNGIYPGTCRDKQLQLSDTNHAWRIKAKEYTIEFNDLLKGKICWSLERMGDFIIRRKDGLPAYQVTSLVDDLHYGINFIVRGDDLMDSTAAQIWLATILNADSFLESTFCHHPLVLEARGQKMSKSHQSLSLQTLQEKWHHPTKIYQLFAQLTGMNPAIDNLIDLAAQFDSQIHYFQKDVYLRDLLSD
ncbi:MAG: glutamate--tRNA ligase family protein [Flammeovirgaceae bacterium]